MNQGRGPGRWRPVRAGAQALAVLSLAVLGMGGAAVAAPEGDQGPPEQAQGNGPPAEQPAPQANVRAHARAQVGAQAQARGQGHSTTGAGVTGRANAEQRSGGRAGGQGTAVGTTQGSTHANAGKVTLCHATGSETNPYVGITVSGNAVAAHDRHQNDEDIIPATGDCPGGAAPSRGHGNENEHGKVTICHATGSETNPYVLIEVSENAVPAHDRHQNDEDIINPQGDCPSAPIPTGLGNPPSGIMSTPQGEGQLAAGESPAGQNGVLGVSEEQGEGPGAEEGAVQGANQGGGEEAAATRDTTGTSLPFTGLGLGLMVALGALLAFAGTRLRRRTA